MNQSNLLVVAPDRLFREGLKRLFEGSTFHVVAEVADANRIVEALPPTLDIDIAIIELVDESDTGFDVLEPLHVALPAAKIVILASRIAPGLARYLSSHVSALLSKDLSPSALFHALELVRLNEDVLSIAPSFLAEEQPEAVGPIVSPADTTDLSPRELEILRHIANGRPNKAIARKLDVAETTVKAYVKAILKKTKAENRTQAAVWCIANGLNIADGLEAGVQTEIGHGIPPGAGIATPPPFFNRANGLPGLPAIKASDAIVLKA